MIRPLKVREYWAALRSSRRFSRLTVISCSKTWRARSSCVTVLKRDCLKKINNNDEEDEWVYVRYLQLSPPRNEDPTRENHDVVSTWMVFRFPKKKNCSGKAKRTHTVDPSLRAASSLLDRISFRMLVREYCAASSSCSEGIPLYIEKMK